MSDSVCLSSNWTWKAEMRRTRSQRLFFFFQYTFFSRQFPTFQLHLVHAPSISFVTFEKKWIVFFSILVTIPLASESERQFTKSEIIKVEVFWEGHKYLKKSSFEYLTSKLSARQDLLHRKPFLKILWSEVWRDFYWCWFWAS